MLPPPTTRGLHLRQRPPFSGRHPNEWLPDRLIEMREAAYANARAPFVGLTTDGTPRRGLFRLQPTGISTEPIKAAADAYLASLSPQQRASGQLALDAAEWLTWSNISPYVMRHGLLLEDLSEEQRQRALALIQASLSASGFQTTRDAMRLNETIGELTGAWHEYGEFVYFLTIFGTPSLSDGWGWQLDGHHCNLNCLILGDQLVLAPAFLGSEPVYAESGKHQGTRVFGLEEYQGVEMMRALRPEQQARARVGSRFVSNEGHIQGGAHHDNIQLPYAGIAYTELDAAQQQRLIELIGLYTGRLPDGHDALKLDEVRAHLDETYFAWHGGTDDDSTFYYRIHSPVVLIEFDHQAGIVFDNEQPARIHIHTVVRTPNGGDYGKDLLRQHYEQAAHHAGAGGQTAKR